MTQQLAPEQKTKKPADEDRPVRTVAAESRDPSAKRRPRPSKQVPDRPFLPGYYLG